MALITSDRAPSRPVGGDLDGDRGTTSRRRDCHSAGALSPSLLEHLLKVATSRGGCSRLEKASPTAQARVVGPSLLQPFDFRLSRFFDPSARVLSFDNTPPLPVLGVSIGINRGVSSK